MAVPETMIEGFAFERSLMKQDIPYEPVRERRILLQPSPYKESSGSKLKKRLLSNKKSGKMKATKHIKVTGRAKRRKLRAMANQEILGAWFTGLRGGGV